MKARLCCFCQRPETLYLWAGRLWCLWCLPVDEMPMQQHVEVLRERHQALMKIQQQRQEEREDDGSTDR